MAATVFTDEFRNPSRTAAALNALREAWLNFRQRREDRLALARAGQLGPRLLADIGLDPEDIRSTLGGWDDLRPNGFLVQRRR